MPETNIDQSAGITSIRLKVPTGTVPVPPVGFGQLHSPSPGVLALRLPDGSVVQIGPPAGGGGSGLPSAGVQLTDTQIKGLRDAPVTVLSAPGPGLMRIVWRAFWLADFSGGVYGNVNAVAPFTAFKLVADPVGNFDYLTNGAGQDLFNPFNHAGVQWWVDVPAAGTAPTNQPVSIPVRRGDVSNWANQPVAIGLDDGGQVASGALTGGHAANTLSVRVWYSDLPAAPFGS